MKEQTPQRCIFCGAPINDSHPNEKIHIHRWIKAPQRIAKREKTNVDLPTCELCHKKLHPYSKTFSRFAVSAGIFAAACVLFGFIQRDFFSELPFYRIIVLVFCVGGAAFLTWISYVFAFDSFDEAFSASVKVKPYNDLPVVKYIIEKGFVDENDENYKIVSVEDEEYVPFLKFRDVLMDTYQVK